MQISAETTHRFDVVVVGGGPAGIGAVESLVRAGVSSVLLLERSEQLGGIPAFYRRKSGGIRTFASLRLGGMVFGEDYARWLRGRIAGTPVVVWLECKVLSLEPGSRTVVAVSPDRGVARIHAQAVVLACGARESTADELGWLAGSREGRIYQTKGILELLDGDGLVPLRRPVVFGSNLNAYAVAAKLAAAGAGRCVIVDAKARPSCPLYGRWYFGLRGCSPRFIGGVRRAVLGGDALRTSVELDSGEILPCDGVVVSGDLLPNSELALSGGLLVGMPGRVPVADTGHRLSAPGWFAAGNILGGFQSAEWCYHHGRAAGRGVARSLQT